MLAEGPCLVMGVGDRLCALRVADVVETLRPLPLTPLPGLPPWVAGVAAIRAVVTPVVHLAALLELPAAAAAPRRLVTVRTPRGPVAVAVDAVLGVRHLGATPEAPGDVAVGCGAVDAVVLWEGRVLLHVAADRLLPDEVWRCLPPTGAAP